MGLESFDIARAKYFRLMILINAVLIVIYGICNWDIWRVVYEIISSKAGYPYSKFSWSPIHVRIDYGTETWITFPNLSIIMLLIVAIANLMVIWRIEKHKG